MLCLIELLAYLKHLPGKTGWFLKTSVFRGAVDALDSEGNIS
jgi:hypothetical protein